MKNLLKHLINLFFYKISLLVNVVFDLFSYREDCKGESMQSGELIVTGENKVKINLKSYPSLLNVKFANNCVIVPCNSSNFDELEYEVVSHNHHFILVIKWKVTGIRNIVWVSYS